MDSAPRSANTARPSILGGFALLIIPVTSEKAARRTGGRYYFPIIHIYVRRLTAGKYTTRRIHRLDSRPNLYSFTTPYRLPREMPRPRSDIFGDPALRRNALFPTRFPYWATSPSPVGRGGFPHVRRRTAYRNRKSAIA